MSKQNHISSTWSLESPRYLEGRQAVRSMKRILLQFRGKLDDQLRPNGVTTAQLQVLFAVKANPGSSGAQLARSCYITPQTTQTLLKHLEKAGLIVRGKDPVNDRILTTRITPEGERLMQEVERESLAIQAELWKGVSDEELTQLNALLERCIANLGASEEAENALCSSGKS